MKKGEIDIGLKLRKRDALVAERKKLLFDASKDLLRQLGAIPAVLIKGEALSLMAYGDTGYRDYHDIDLLIHKRDVKTLRNLLKESGFVQCVFDENGNPRQLTRKEEVMLMNSHQTVPFYKEEGGVRVEIDVNFDIFWGEYRGKRIAVDELLEDSILMDIYGYAVPVLPPVKAFIQVCLHHYKEMNGAYFFSLKNAISVPMFHDIYMLFKKCVKDSMEELLSILSRYQIQAYIYYMLYYTNLIFEDGSMEEALQALHTPEGEKLLHGYGLTEEERKNWSMDFWERLDNPKLYESMKADLNETDIKKIESVLSIYY